MKLQRPDPGIDAAKSGLHGKAGIFFNAGLFSKGGGFNPLDLDPYLLFDARTSMIGTLENPTLDLDPSKQDTLDVITATRAGVATYTDVNGNIASAPANTVRVDQTQGAELTPTKFQRVENTDFSQWSHARTSGTANAAISPDGQNNATYVEQDAGQTNAGSIFRFNSALTGVFTLSVYAKKKEKDFVVLYDSNIGRTYFNLETGTVGTIAAGNTANIEDAGNGWFRCSTTFTASSGAVKAFYVGDTDNSLVVTGSGGIYIWGPQLEEGTTASDFVANTTGSPKFITGATFGPRVPMILVEPSSENLVTNSTSFTENVDITKTTGIDAPDGTNTASKISGILSSSSSDMAYSIASTVTSSTQVTGSIYVRGIAGEVVVLRIKRYTGGAYVASGPQTVTLTGDWQRIEGLTMTLGADNTNAAVSIRKESGSTADSVDLWGGQIELGSVSTSVIPTSGSTVTRAADELVISGSQFSNFFNGSAGTFFIQAQNRTPELNGAVLMGQNSNKLFFYKPSPNRLSTYDGGSFTHHDGLVANQLFNAAVTFNTSNRSSSLDGSALDTETITTQWAGADILKIGFGYSNNFNGHYRRILFWPYHSDSL
jgi:hypothetical protein